MSLLSILGELTLALGNVLARPATLEPSGSARDGGGNVLAYGKAVDKLIESGDPYVAPLVSKSAATMLVKAPNVIWRPRSTLHFHSADLLGGNSSFVDAYNEKVASYYPPKLRRWFLYEGPGKTRSTDFVVFTPQELNERFDAGLNIRGQD